MGAAFICSLICIFNFLGTGMIIQQYLIIVNILQALCRKVCIKKKNFVKILVNISQ